MPKNTNQYKTLFIHISKTAGASICTAPWVIVQATPTWDPKIAVEDNDLLLSFTFVRDPYTRFSSAALNQGYATPETFEEWTLNTFTKEYKEKFEAGLERKDQWQELLPQSHYLLNKGGEEHAINFIGRFERLKDDWAKVCTMAGEIYELPKLNTNKHPDHEKYHTDATRQVVREAYEKDFELLGYQK